MHIFLNENHAIGFQILFAFVEECEHVLVSQVAEDPLDPDDVVLVFEFKFLKSFHIETKPIIINEIVSYFSTLSLSTYSFAF